MPPKEPSETHLLIERWGQGTAHWGALWSAKLCTPLAQHPAAKGRRLRTVTPPFRHYS